jgi:TRAP-type C4-dicarboxylate transport system permease large subunit
MNLFIASYRFGKPVVLLYRAAFPFLVMLLLTVLIITYVPWLSTVLLR